MKVLMCRLFLSLRITIVARRSSLNVKHQLVCQVAAVIQIVCIIWATTWPYRDSFPLPARPSRETLALLSSCFITIGFVRLSL